jgi:hypothetical protein
MPSSHLPVRRIEPEFLGPLSDRPLAENTRSSDPDDLFPGASAFLGGRQRRRRRKQWDAVGFVAEKLLKADEHVLYVAHGMQVPPALHFLALGHMALLYHQVILVLTDTRVIEVLLGVRGKKAETRIRSFPWDSVRDLKASFGKLILSPAVGKKQTWRVPLRGDRRLLKLLLPRLKARLLPGGAAMAQALPLWHCPQCAATMPANPHACASCRTPFRSTRLAALLSLAFPGAGLLYAGHPYLAAADFLGEVLFYLVFVLLMLEAEPGHTMVALGLGAVLFILTKAESAHLSQILVSRAKPETELRRSRYQRLAMVGGLASLLLIGGALPLAGAARSVVDRDLDVAGQECLWQGSRNAAQWDAFEDDPAARSQWRHPSGTVVTLFAYPQQLLEGVTEFRNGVRLGLEQQGVTVVKEDEDLPSPFRGFRFVTRATTQEGKPIMAAQYFVVDEQNHDIHQAVAAAIDDDPATIEAAVNDLLSHARWIGPTPPERPMAGSEPPR